MRIRRAEVIRLPLTLREPYTIAYETITTSENLVLRLVTDGPHVGLGVAAPDHGVTGETLSSCLDALNSVLPVLSALDPLRRTAVTEAMSDALPDHPAARAAIDMALFDLLGKTADLPVWRLLGGFRDHMPTSATVFIVPVDEAVQRARAFVDQGFRAIKLKGGLDVLEDVDRLGAMRRAVGPDIDLRFDANQGYTVVQAKQFVDAVRHLHLSIFEQPTPAGDLAKMRSVVCHDNTPIMADESILSRADAFRFARHDAMDMANLKLQKVGGIDEALLINGVARAAGMEVMVGCMDEAALSIAAGLAFALSRRNVEFADLDGHLDFLDDPTGACVRVERGIVYPSEAPGFGLVDL